MYLLDVIHSSCAGCAAKKYASVCGVKRRCLLKIKTKIVDGKQLPVDPCYHPTTKRALFIDFKYNNKVSEASKKKFTKIIKAHKSWSLNIPTVKVTCYKCGEVFETKMQDKGWFPKMRKCTHCNAKNYIA